MRNCFVLFTEERFQKQSQRADTTARYWLEETTTVRTEQMYCVILGFVRYRVIATTTSTNTPAAVATDTTTTATNTADR